MKRCLPFPLLSLSLLAMWLLLNRTLWPGHVLLGMLLGLGGGLVLAALQAPAGGVRRGVRRGVAVVELFWLVLLDVVRSNLAVARLVLQQRAGRRVAGFIHMPLALRHPGALAVLACIVTATPGTSWARYDRKRHVLTIHVFDLIDEHQWIETFKHRYEGRLMEIFE